MATKSKMVLRSNFPAVKKAAREVQAFAIAAALSEGKATAQEKIDRVGSQRGYNLTSLQVEKEFIGHQSGKIYVNPWWARFFEYGTVHIAAMPFMRPAHRKMRKVFVEVMAADFEGWVRRRVRVH